MRPDPTPRPSDEQNAVRRLRAMLVSLQHQCHHSIAVACGISGDPGIRECRDHLDTARRSIDHAVDAMAEPQ